MAPTAGQKRVEKTCITINCIFVVVVVLWVGIKQTVAMLLLEVLTSLRIESFLHFCSLGFFEVLIPFWSLGLFSYPEIAPILSLTYSFYTRDAQIRIVILLGSVIMAYKKLIKILEFVLGMFSLWFFRPTLRPSSSSMFWGFINNCTQFVRGGVGDEALQPLFSFFSFKSVTSLLENVQGLLNVKDPTSLVFHLMTFLYMVYSFSRMSHTLLNTVGQQIEAREQGDKSVTQAAANPTAIQAAAKPDSEAKTPAVAAVKKGKKHTDKTDRPVDDDSGEGSSVPPDTQSEVKPPDTQSEAEATDDTQSEAEPTDTKSEAQPTGTRSGVQPTSTRSEAQPAATRSGAQPTATTSRAQPTATRSGARPTATRSGDTIESFSLKDLRGLRKDYTRRPDESIISWLVRLWDAAGEATILDGTEVRHLSPLSHAPVIDQEMMREASPCSLWERVLRSVAQRYLCADDLYLQQTQWKTIEQGIQRLREMAVAEIVFSDDLNTRNPDLVPCTPVMWRKLVRLGPQEYSSALAIMKRDETEETVLDMAKKLRTYADAVHGPTHARIAALETQMRGLADKIKEDLKELKENILQISAVQVRGSGTTRKRSLDREGKGIPRAKLWSFLRDCGENMKRWDGESTDAMTQRLHELLDGKTVRGSSSKKEAAPVTQGNKDNQA